MKYDIIMNTINKIKNMPINNVNSSLLAGLKRLGFGVLTIMIIGSAVIVRADTFDAQINALQEQNSSVKGLLNGLTSQASSYQSVVNNLRYQVYTLQVQIQKNQDRQFQLEQQIVEAQNKIDTKKRDLGEVIKAMYFDGDITTIEQLAISDNLSDYIDKQAYRQKVQDQLNITITQIGELQAQLKQQKVEVDTLVQSQKSQRSQLYAKEAEQSDLLAYNQSQQNEYNSQIDANTGQIAELRRLQIIANNRYSIGNYKGDPNNGGYPNVWANAYQDSLDDWGMYNRECVSFTAFKVHQDFLLGKNSRDMPYWGGIGNANEWPRNARAAGIRVDTNPAPGSIAISMAGFYGHSMYVEAVNGDKIYIQQYNQQLDGQYSEGWRYTTGLVFLHFD